MRERETRETREREVRERDTRERETKERENRERELREKEIEKEKEREKQKEVEKEREKIVQTPQVRDGKESRDKDRDLNKFIDVKNMVTPMIIEAADKKDNRKQRLPSEENTQILYDSRFDNSNKNTERWGNNEQQPSYNTYRKVSRSRSRSRSKGKRSNYSLEIMID